MGVTGGHDQHRQQSQRLWAQLHRDLLSDAQTRTGQQQHSRFGRRSRTTPQVSMDLAFLLPSDCCCGSGDDNQGLPRDILSLRCSSSQTCWAPGQLPGSASRLRFKAAAVKYDVHSPSVRSVLLALNAADMSSLATPPPAQSAMSRLKPATLQEIAQLTPTRCSLLLGMP